jgi:predicted nucleic acid binding AN1-type Zn finger protein
MNVQDDDIKIIGDNIKKVTSEKLNNVMLVDTLSQNNKEVKILENIVINEPINKNITKCNKQNCGKKLGLLPFTCKCGLNFCGLHRYSDTHDCEFDYRSEYKKQLEKNNIKVVAEKIKKI